MAIVTWNSEDLEKAGVDIHLPVGLNKSELEQVMTKRLEEASIGGNFNLYQLNGHDIEFVQFG